MALLQDLYKKYKPIASQAVSNFRQAGNRALTNAFNPVGKRIQASTPVRVINDPTTLAGRAARNFVDLPKGVVTAAAAPFMTGEQLLKFNPRVVEEDYARRIGGTFFDTATLPVGGAQVRAGLQAGKTVARPILKTIGTRAAEGAAFSGVRSASQFDKPADIARNTAFGAGVGALVGGAEIGVPAGISKGKQLVRETRANQALISRPGFSPGFAKVGGVSSDPLEALKNEARKYKSAEEFVRAQPIKIYHSTNQANKDIILRDGFKKGSDLPENAFRGGGYGQMQDSISFADNVKDASRFGISQKNTLIEAELKPNAKIIKRTDIEYAEELNDEIPRLLKEGIDAVRLPNAGEGEIVVINKKAIQKITDTFDYKGVEAKDLDKLYKSKSLTKSQLTDIWKEATTSASQKAKNIQAPQRKGKVLPQPSAGQMATTPATLPPPTSEARIPRILKPPAGQAPQLRSPSSLSPSFDASIDQSRLNIKRQNVSQAAKQELANAVEDIKPRIEQTIGKKLTHNEVRAAAGNIRAELKRTLTREDTEELGARALALRQKIASLADETTRTGRATPELLDAIETDLSFAANAARLLGQRAIDAEPVTKGLAEQYIRAVMRAGATLDNIKAAAANVDFNNPEQAALFYRQFVKPTMGEWVDVIRYNSMLSSPLTHIVNIASNLQAGPVRALTKTVTGGVDWLGSSLSKKPREQFAGEGLAYAKGYLGEVRNAWKNMVGIMKGDILPQLQDFRESNIPLAVTGRSGQAEAVLSIPMRLLEGMDQFFMALGRGGEAGALNLRRAKGGKLPSSMSGLADEIQNQAQASIFRTKLGTKGQGTMSEAIDDLALRISELRKSDNELVAGVAKFTFPFLQTPTNIFKQGLEYGPLGLINTKTAANRAEVISKAIIGSTIMSGAAAMAFSDRITFSAPTSEKERLLWKKAGKQEYSIKVGDKWVSYNKLHPAIAFPFALVAGVKEATDNKKITDSQGETILSAASKIFNFLFDQSYMKSIGTFMDLAQGGEGTWARISSNYLQQLVPGRAIGGWFARMLDEYERTGTPGASFWQKQFESLMMQTPGLRGFTPARIDETGAPIRAQYPVINALSPLRLSKENKEGVEELDVYKEEQKLRRDVNALREDVRNQLKSEQMRSSTGASAAEVAPESVDKLSKFKQGELMPGVTQRGNLYAYKIDGEIKVTSDRDKANLDVAKDTFKKTDKAIQEWGELVLRKNKDGSVTTMSKDDYALSINTNKMQSAKKRNDVKSWLTTAQEQLKIYDKQLQDKTLDELEKSDILEKADTLIGQMIKYQGYGGSFTKPKKGAKAKLTVISKPKGLSASKSNASVSRPAFGRRLSVRRPMGRKAVRKPTVTTAIKRGY